MNFAFMASNFSTHEVITPLHGWSQVFKNLVGSILWRVDDLMLMGVVMIVMKL
jgi:hypothetical protein